MNGIVNALGKMLWAKRAHAVFALCAATAIASSAQTFTTLFNFDKKNGLSPTAPLIQGIDGNFYGTTEGGGNSYQGHRAQGYGTIFRITPTGKLTTVYNFECPNGSCPSAYPAAGLLQDADGNFYGTTTGYIVPFDGPDKGATSQNGTIFEIMWIPDDDDQDSETMSIKITK